jgi:hypothetical protein
VTARGTVLLGFADALAAPEVVFSLRDAGFAVRPFSREGAGRPLLSRLSAETPVVLPAPEVDAEAAITSLRAAAADNPPAAVLALDDAALWLVDQAFGGDCGPPLASAHGPQAEIALDKTRQIDLAAAAGFEVPPTRIARKRADILSHSSFPAIVKPALAAELRGTRLGRGSPYYLSAATDFANLPPDDKLSYPAVIQPLIPGRGEGIFGFAAEGGVTNWSGHRRVRMMNPHGSGASACRINAVEPKLREAAEHLVTSMGWRGPFMIELLRSADGTAYFMELNGRLWGSTALSRRAGFEYPAWAVEQALDPSFAPPPTEPIDPGVIRHLGRDLLHLLFVLRGPRSAFHREHWPRFWPTTGQVLRPAPGRQFYNWDAACSRFYLRDALVTIANFLRRKR